MTTHKRQRLLGPFPVVLGLMGALIMQGCSGSEEPDTRPARTKISGTVTYNDNPLADAIITFHPVEAGKSGSNGRSNAEGLFEMGTFEATDGVLPGQYEVTITKLDGASGANAPSEDDPDYDPNPAPESEPKNLLPKKYSDPKQSGLTISVQDGQEVTDLKFELAD